MGRRGRFFVALLAAAAVLVLMSSIQGSAARAEIDNTCMSSRVCVWPGEFYFGEEKNYSCGEETNNGLEMKSAKDLCSVNVRIGWAEFGTTNWKACLSPGGERPAPTRFNRVLPSGC
jgi:hypothetical protein